MSRSWLRALLGVGAGESTCEGLGISVAVEGQAGIVEAPGINMRWNRSRG